MQSSWQDVIIVISAVVADAELPACPACHQGRVDYLYVGDETTRLGYLVAWCAACLVGTRISRARAPEGAHFMSFAEAETAIVGRVPAFREVPPT